MESESYERFGRRCERQEYIRLGALLSQNLRKGGKGLGQLLKTEAIQAQEERKAHAKRAGEEAGAEIMWRWYRLKQVLQEEDGIGVVEVILILVVLIGLVLIFKSQLTSLVETIFEKITSESSGI